MSFNEPHIVIVSESGGIEFPADWTLREEDISVVLVSDFSSVTEIKTEEEYDSLEESSVDWCDVSVRHLLLFEREEVMERFNAMVGKHSCEVRVLTETDKKRYGI